MKQAGIEHIKSGFNYDPSSGVYTGVATGTVKLGKRVINVSYLNGQIFYHSDSLGKDFHTMDELTQAEYDELVYQLTNANEQGAHLEVPTYE